MRRRHFITLIGGAAAAWPLTVHAQQPKKPAVIGYLSGSSDAAGRALADCFLRELRELGWIEGKNFEINYRWSGGVLERNATLMAELLALHPDLIVASSTQAAQTAQRATQQIPVVFIAVSDPVASGIVASLARPGANITGVSNFLPATTAKLLELLKTVTPNAARIGVLYNPTNDGKLIEMRELEVAAPVMGVSVKPLPVSSSDDFERAFQKALDLRVDSLVTLVEGVTLINRSRIAEFADRNRLPAIYQIREFVAAGGLMSYGLNYCQHFRRAATYVDKLLKGARPADLPVELPTAFELIVNVKAAKAIGLTIPESFLLRADEVIE
jgi:putative tryptophan/tyrosine transport system substrate-binding protein